MASIGHLESPDTSTKVTLIDSPSIRRCSPGARVNSPPGGCRRRWRIVAARHQKETKQEP